MSLFVRKDVYTGYIQAVVLDWAGTAVDFGCMGPAAVFVAVFKEKGIDVSVGQARQFMGLEKKDHIRKMCALETVAADWQKKYGRLPGDADIDALYDRTADMMVAALENHSDPIPGVLDVVAALRGAGIKIGSCTGYVREMMDVLVPRAREKGYAPDAVFCSSDVPAGRPYPWMCYQNAIALDVYPMEAMVKVGDTIADIQEGLNAGMWTVGIVETGNEMGLAREDLESLGTEARNDRVAEISRRFYQAGAHYVLNHLTGLPKVIRRINGRLVNGEQPLTMLSKERPSIVNGTEK